MAEPCDVCRKVHENPCEEGDGRSVKFCVTLPAGVGRLLRDRVPWGERSPFVAALIEKELAQ